MLNRNLPNKFNTCPLYCEQKNGNKLPLCILLCTENWNLGTFVSKPSRISTSESQLISDINRKMALMNESDSLKNVIFPKLIIYNLLRNLEQTCFVYVPYTLLSKDTFLKNVYRRGKVWQIDTTWNIKCYKFKHNKRIIL